MNQTEILKMLNNIIAHDQQYTTWTVSTPHLVELVNRAIKAEREACAKVCDKFNFGQAPKMIQDAIRARGQA